MKTRFVWNFVWKPLQGADWNKSRLLRLILTFVVCATLISLIVEHVEAPREAVNIFPRLIQPERPLTIYAVGNINVAAMNTEEWFSEKSDPKFAALLREIGSADVALGNLNCQIADNPPTTERLRDYSAPSGAADALANAGFDVLSTASHLSSLMNVQSLHDTRAHLKKVGIRTVGTGQTIDEAWEPAVIERHGWRMAVFAVTASFNKNYFGLPTQSGLATANIAQLSRQIGLVRHRFDLILVSYSGGGEQQALPVADARAFAQRCIDAGADAVFCQNQLSPVPHEYYEGHPVIYNLGDFPGPAAADDSAVRNAAVARLMVRAGKEANSRPEFVLERVSIIQ